MDIATIVGLVVTLVLIVGTMHLGAGIGFYLDAPALLTVVGGTIGALLANYRIEQIKNLFRYFLVALKPTGMDVPRLIKQLVEYAALVRRDGILTLESAMQKEQDLFLKKGLAMAINGSEPEMIRTVLEIDKEQTDIRHKTNAAIFGQLGSYAGMMGLIGVLIGVVAMLVNLENPLAIGPSLAVALLSALYGAVIAIVLGAPIEQILMMRNEEEMLYKRVVIGGIMAIQAGDSPPMLEAKLLAFLPAKERVSQFDS